MSNFQHITIEDNGRLLAEADVESHSDLVDARLRVEAGQIPPGARSQLVDAVLDLPNVPPRHPAGDDASDRRRRNAGADPDSLP
jgi:hypothetical protein